MNKSAIKTFAVWARKKMIADVREKAATAGITDKGIDQAMRASTDEIQYFDNGTSTPFVLTGKDITARKNLASMLRQNEKDTDYATAYKNMLEETASAWFNRLIAIRYMEVNDYFADHLRVLSSAEADRKDPDIVIRPFESDLEFTETERLQIIQWKMENENDTLFRFLFKKKCNELQALLPGLFENDEKDMAFLLNFSFTDKDGVIYHLIHDIPEDDWKKQVQIIGWIYQYYNTELKDETFSELKKKKKITKEKIPSVTQLFTPDWIVRYMVENSLGRLWLEHLQAESVGMRAEYADGSCFGWEYYLKEAEQEPDVQAQLDEIKRSRMDLNPEEIRFCDPCMGSGHILVYAFDVLMQIYGSLGYSAREAASLIVEKNLWGLDIDVRAYQLAYFSIMMKGRQYDRRFFSRDVHPNVFVTLESSSDNKFCH